MPPRIAQIQDLCGSLSFMDIHRTQGEPFSKEIQCEDCGSRYRIAPYQMSSRCVRCGNIVFHSQDAEPLRDLVQEEVATTPGKLGPADGHKVQEILARYQVEWQLWAMVVQNFTDPNFHGAYLAHATARGIFDQAVKRYSDHRAVMLLGNDTRWQAEVAELMLARLKNLSVVGMKLEGQSRWAWVYTLPLDSRALKIGWIALGMVLFFKLLTRWL